MELDTTAHRGDSMEGRLIRSPCVTDIKTGWVCVEPVAGVTASHVAPVVKGELDRSPFPVWGLHSDNGGEFINQHMLRLCERRNLLVTRGRPNHKNDNPHVEQKNWAPVRRVAGYRRRETGRSCGSCARSTGCWRRWRTCSKPTRGWNASGTTARK